MQVTTARSKEKDYDIYLKSGKTGSQPVGVRKKCFPAIWKWKKLVPSYFEPHKHCCNYLEREKSGFLLYGDQKMQFTTVRSKEKDYDIYLKSEKLVHSQQEHKKMFPSYLEVEKTGSQLFRASQTLLQLFRERKKWISAIWRPKNVVHNSQDQGKRL